MKRMWLYLQPKSLEILGIFDRMTAKERDKFPTGQQAIPSMDPHWDLDSDHGDWSRKHLLTCVLEGLRR